MSEILKTREAQAQLKSHIEELNLEGRFKEFNDRYVEHGDGEPNAGTLHDAAEGQARLDLIKRVLKAGRPSATRVQEAEAAIAELDALLSHYNIFNGLFGEPEKAPVRNRKLAQPVATEGRQEEPAPAPDLEHLVKKDELPEGLQEQRQNIEKARSAYLKEYKRTQAWNAGNSGRLAKARRTISVAEVQYAEQWLEHMQKKVPERDWKEAVLNFYHASDNYLLWLENEARLAAAPSPAVEALREQPTGRVAKLAAAFALIFTAGIPTDTHEATLTQATATSVPVSAADPLQAPGHVLYEDAQPLSALVATEDEVQRAERHRVTPTTPAAATADADAGEIVVDATDTPSS